MTSSMPQPTSGCISTGNSSHGDRTRICLPYARARAHALSVRRSVKPYDVVAVMACLPDAQAAIPATQASLHVAATTDGRLVPHQLLLHEAHGPSSAAVADFLSKVYGAVIACHAARRVARTTLAMVSTWELGEVKTAEEAIPDKCASRSRLESPPAYPRRSLSTPVAMGIKWVSAASSAPRTTHGRCYLNEVLGFGALGQ